MTTMRRSGPGEEPPNPYVGPRSIRLGEPIYGRDSEIADLSDTLLTQRIALVYSPSGAGKTSLIEAGLRPHLAARGFHVLPTVRVGLETPGSRANRYTLSTKLSLREAVPEESQLTEEAFLAMSLDEYLGHVSRHVVADDQDTCVVLDQFEELFTLDPTDPDAKREFLQELGVALRRRDRWVLVSMREDFIAHLDPFLHLIPTRFAGRFRLALLEPDAAMLAARLPAASAGWEFDEDAAERLVDDLRRVQMHRGDSVVTELGPFVEPVVLQVVCSRLWDRIAAA